MLDPWTLLLVTVAVEIPVVVVTGVALGRFEKVDLGWLALVALSGSCLTAPVAHHVHGLMLDVMSAEASVGLLFAATIVVETLFYAYVMRMRRRIALVYSVAANGAAAIVFVGMSTLGS